jgi:PEP-CTERM motif
MTRLLNDPFFNTRRIALVTSLLFAGAAQAASVSLSNAGFESTWENPGFVGSDGTATFYYRPSGSAISWAFVGGSGVSNNYSLLSAYEGTRFGLLQLGDPADPFGSSGAHFSQTFNLDSASTIDLSFALALRPNYAAGQSVAVAVDGNIVQTIQASSTSWTLKTMSLGPLAAGVHTLGFAGMANHSVFGDTSAFVDDVQLNTVPEPASCMIFLAGLGLIGSITRRRSLA